MKPFEIITYRGKQIALLDITNSQPEEQIAYYQNTQPIIASYPPHSLLVLADASNVRFNAESNAAIQEFAIKNTPYVKASAVVGAEGLRYLVWKAVEQAAARHIKPFETRQEALDWLAELP